MSKQLSNSPSYMRYIALRGLPLGIEPFKDGDVLVLGETKCRFEDDGEMCSKQLESPGALSNHVKKYHPVILGKAPTTGNPGMERIQSAKKWYKDVMNKHDANISTTRSEAVPSPAPFRSRRREDKGNGNGTTGSEQVVIPTGDARLVLPTYKSSNKKTGVKKGDLNFNAMAKLLKDAGGKIPCEYCAPGPKCKWSEDCISTQWFIYSDDEDSNGDE